MPLRGALLFTGSGPNAALPNHISFLWSRSNDALLSFLSPLLPVAKLLRIFVLDFDVYKRERDSHRTARSLVPTLRRFFASGTKSWPDTGDDGFRPDFRRRNFGRTPELELGERRQLEGAGGGGGALVAGGGRGALAEGGGDAIVLGVLGGGDAVVPTADAVGEWTADAVGEWRHCGASALDHVDDEWLAWIDEADRRMEEAWAAGAAESAMSSCLGAIGLTLGSHLDLALSRLRAWQSGADAPETPAAGGTGVGCEVLRSGQRSEGGGTPYLPPFPDFSNKFEIPFPFPFPAIPKPEREWERLSRAETDHGMERVATDGASAAERGAGAFVGGGVTGAAVAIGILALLGLVRRMRRPARDRGRVSLETNRRPKAEA